MVNCFVVGCKTGNNSKETYHAFRVPRKAGEDIIQQWRKNVPKRQDRVYDPSHDFICYKHFDEKFLIKEYIIHGPGGEIMVKEPRKHWKLAETAVPSIFANAELPQSFDKKLTARKPPIRRNLQDPKTKRTKFRKQKIGAKDGHVQTQAGLSFDRAKLQLPMSWHFVQQADFFEVSKLVYTSECPVKMFAVEKCIKVSVNIIILY